MQKRKILLVHLYSNGDCLYATAIARQIKKDFPNCELTWAIAEFCKSIIYNNPYIDTIREVNDVKKNDVTAFRKFKKKILLEKKKGLWDEVFITHNMDSNIKYYDGTIRGMILRAYPLLIENIQPELQLTDEEIKNVQVFAEKYSLHNFKNVILWEYAPQSGQSDLTFDFVTQVSKKIVSHPNTCVILTSANRFESSHNIIDASVLSIRENAALTHYCNLLIGCSSGITWLSTSNAAKQLPTIQLLNPYAPFRNIPSEDFKRHGLPTSTLVEIFNFDKDTVHDCVDTFIKDGIEASRKKFHQNLPESFLTTEHIVYNLLCYLNIKGIREHIKIMKSVYGNHNAINKAVKKAIAGFPLKLLRNFYTNRIVPVFSK
ncbi:MAG: glycosyltransferase family 9 protein [Niabella sp.]